MTGIRLLLGYTDRKFRRLINLAVSQRLIRMEGDNLLIHGKQADRRLFGRLKRKQEVKRADIKAFYQMSVLKKNVNQQEIAKKTKDSTMSNGRVFSEPDSLYNLHNLSTNEVTLSIRKIAKLFSLKVPTAYALSKHLVAFGLTLKINKVSIDLDHYKHYQRIGHSHNLRVNYDGGQFYYLKASIPVFGEFYKVEKTSNGNGYYTSDNFLNNW